MVQPHRHVDTVCSHLLHEHTTDARLRTMPSCVYDYLRKRSGYCRAIGEIQQHAARLCFVQYFPRFNF